MNIELNETEIRIVREAIAVWVMHPQIAASGRILGAELRALGVHPEDCLNQAGIVALQDAQIDSANREFHSRRLRHAVESELALEEAVTAMAD